MTLNKDIKSTLYLLLGQKMNSYASIAEILNTSDWDAERKQEEIEVSFNRIAQISREQTFLPKSEATKYIDEIEELMKKNLEILDSETQLFVYEILEDKNLSTGLVLVYLLAEVFNKIKTEGKTNFYVSETNLAMLLQTSFLEAILLNKFLNKHKNGIKEKKKRNSFQHYKHLHGFEKISTKNKLQIGYYCYICLFNAGFIEQVDIPEERKFKKVQVKLSSIGAKAIRVIKQTNVSFPSLIKPNNYHKEECENDASLYQNTISGLYSNYLYHSNDSTNIRDYSTVISDSCFESVNYLQSTKFKISTQILIYIVKNIDKVYIEYCENNTKALFYDSESAFLGSLSKDSTYRSKLESIKDYHKSAATLEKFMEILAIGFLYQNFDIYYNFFLCWRGRVYMSNFPFNPQADLLVRKLIQFGNDNELLIEDNTDKLIPVKTNHSLIACDATASGCQIIGLLTGSLDVLHDTYFFESDTNDDIYMKSLHFFIKKLYDTEIYKSNPDILKVFNRKFFKNIIMCRVYSEGVFSRTDKIMEEVINNRISIKRKDATLLAKLVDSTFSECYPDIIKFENVLKEICKKLLDREDQKIILRSNENYLKTLIFYPQQENIQIAIKNENKQTKRILIRQNIDPLRVNKRKTKNSFIPNLIHQLDSLILNRLILKYKEIKKESNIYTIHDCFLVEKSEIELVKKLYFESCKDIFLKETHPLEILLLENEIENKELYKYVKKCKEQIEELFKTEKQSNKILK